MFRGREGRAHSSTLLPVVDLTCGGSPLLALPLRDMPKSGEVGGRDVASPNRVFSDDPQSLAMTWDDLRDRVQGCTTAAHAAKGGVQ